MAAGNAGKADRLKLLYRDGTVLVMAYKRREDTSFIWPAVSDGIMALNHAQFKALFSGLDWRKVEALEAPGGSWQNESSIWIRVFLLASGDSFV